MDQTNIENKSEVKPRTIKTPNDLVYSIEKELMNAYEKVFGFGGVLALARDFGIERTEGMDDITVKTLFVGFMSGVMSSINPRSHYNAYRAAQNFEFGDNGQAKTKEEKKEEKKEETNETAG